MIELETIKKILKEYNYISNIEAYKYEGKSGLLINVNIIDATDLEMYRFFTFKNEEELREFLTIYKYMINHKDTIELQLDNIDSFIPKGYKFIKNGKEYLYSDVIKDNEKEEEKKKNIKQDYVNKLEEEYLFYKNKIEYLKFISNIDIEKIKTIVEDLEKRILHIPPTNYTINTSIIENYTFKPNNIKEKIFDINDVKLKTSDDKPELYTNPITEEKVEKLKQDFKKYTLFLDPFNPNSFYKYIENEEKYKESKMYIEKIEYLLSLNKNSKIVNLFNRKSVIKKLKEIENKYLFLSKKEIEESEKKLGELYSYFLEKIEIPNKETDMPLFIKLCMNTTYEQARKNIDSYCENIAKKSKDEYDAKTDKINKKEKLKNIKEKEIFLNLVQQFKEKSLTLEQQQALLAYNSALFMAINIITTIPNYDKLSENEIKAVLSDKFREVLELEEIYYPKEVNATLFYFSEVLINQYRHETEGFGKYIKDIVTDKHYISKILEIIKTLESIRTDIILPEDVTVYRCIGTKNPTPNPSKGKFLSTSLSLEKAKKYYQVDSPKKPVMYKIKIKKGTPITAVMPEKIINTNYGKQLVDDLNSESPVMEIMLNMDDYEVETENIKQYSISNYSKNNNGKLVHGPDFLVYEITIIPKKKVLERIENNEIKEQRHK